MYDHVALEFIIVGIILLIMQIDYSVVFSALTLLHGGQGEYPAYNKIER